MIIRSHRRKVLLGFADAEVDLVPMIDCVFLLLLFFMLCGRITVDACAEQVSVPPAKTGERPTALSGWRREVLNVFAVAPGADERLSLGSVFDSRGLGRQEAATRLRAVLDAIYDSAETYPGPSGQLLPKVVIEIRADGDACYRRVQDLECLLADRVDPASGLPWAPGHVARPFVELNFTTRSPGP